jgi:PIN domain nuclease of toxin-antitoxin system
MKVLLDTNALLWVAYAPGKLTAPAKEAFFSGEDVTVSVVSFWEIGLKMSRGGYDELDVPLNWERSLVAWMEEQKFKIIGVDLAACRKIQDLLFHHKDPFDRMLIAQAINGDFTVITSDNRFEVYGVKRVW